MPNGHPAAAGLVLSQDLQVVRVGAVICAEELETLTAGTPASYDADLRTLTADGREWSLVNPGDADDALYTVEEFAELVAMRMARAGAALIDQVAA